MSDFRSLLRPNIRDLQAYSSARQEHAGEEGIFLDANENALGSAARESLNRYPDPLQKKLKEEIARLKAVSAQQIFLGNGSDEAIDLLLRAFCEPGKDRILIMPPTYGMYEVCAAINDVKVQRVLLRPDFEIDVASVLEALEPRTKLLFICSPNNPTGNVFQPDGIERLLRQFQGLTVLDEAYIDFAPDKSWLPRLSRWPNLVVLQTFSKAWGLADVRLGMAFAQPGIIEVLNKIKHPYNVNGVTQRLALQALANHRGKTRMVGEIIQERDRLQKGLAALDLVDRVYPSDANFLLVKMHDAASVFRRLLQKKIVVRNRSDQPLCGDCLRITVGTPEENRRLLHALKEIDISPEQTE
ncbi:MAG: histidinol-phosphate transaminase [Calditrichaeota bacterium]|nr:MAG: histidinol-phosphate transaminase [Calditrichota bacterium]